MESIVDRAGILEEGILALFTENFLQAVGL